jgi:hypothetical protein
MEEISAVRRGRGEKIVSDNSKCIRASEGGRGVNFQFPPRGRYGCFLELPNFAMYFSGSCIPTNKIKCNNYYYKTLLLQFYNYDVTGAPMGRLR